MCCGKVFYNDECGKLRRLSGQILLFALHALVCKITSGKDNNQPTHFYRFHNLGVHFGRQDVSPWLLPPPVRSVQWDASNRRLEAQNASSAPEASPVVLGQAAMNALKDFMEVTTQIDWMSAPDVRPAK